MMTIKSLLPNCNVKVARVDLLNNEVGNYDYNNDVILIDRSFREDFPHHSILTLIHEIFHATGAPRRNNRISRLIMKYGDLSKGSHSHRVEEIICEAAGLVLARKLGMFDEISRNFFISGINKYNREDISIPWIEVVAAVNHFSDDPEKFKNDLTLVRYFLKTKCKLNIKDSYDN